MRAVLVTALFAAGCMGSPSGQTFHDLAGRTCLYDREQVSCDRPPDVACGGGTAELRLVPGSVSGDWLTNCAGCVDATGFSIVYPTCGAVRCDVAADCLLSGYGCVDQVCALN